MRLRPLESDDAAAIRVILDAVYGDDHWVRSLHEGSHGLPVDQPGFQRASLVAELEGVVVGAGTISHAERHPQRSWLSIDVTPSKRRRGVGTALLWQLRGFSERPLCARARLGDAAGVGFLREQRFEIVDRSWGGRFDPAAVVERLPDPTLSRPPTLDEAALFFERWYREAHAFDPPTPCPLERAREVFCGSLVEGSLVGVRDKGGLIAAAGLIPTPGYDSDDELYLVWAGTSGTNQQAANDVVAACARFALSAGKTIRYEVNQANESIRTTLDEAGVLGDPDLGIFAEEATR
jgi:hypothetical protein